MKPQVFISYAHQDQAVAELVAGALESCGVPCWYYHRNNFGVWDEGILKAIDNSWALVLLLSSHANESNEVKKEVVRASVKNKLEIYPLRLENIEPSDKIALHIDISHMTDAFPPPREDQVQYFAQKLASLKPRPEEPKPKRTVVEVEPRLPAGNLFGREQDLKLALDLLKKHSFSVVGVSGIGKSKLVSAFFEKVIKSKRFPFQVYYWRCFRDDDPVTFSAFARRLIRDLTGEDVEVDRSTVGEQVQMVIKTLKETPCLLVIDQFESTFDPETKSPRKGFDELLTYARDGIGSSRLVVTAWWVPEDSKGTKFSHMLLVGLNREAALKLVEEEVHSHHQKSSKLSQKLRDELVLRVAGHPFALQWLIRNHPLELLETIINDAQLWDGTLEEVAPKIAAKVYRRLPLKLQQMLSTICIFAVPWTIQGAAAITGRSAILKELADLEQRGLVVNLGDGTYEVHQLVKKMVANLWGTEEKLRLHRAAADYYRSLPAPAPAARETIADVQPLLYAVDHLLSAGLVREAGELFVAQDLSEQLHGWSHYVELMRYYDRFLKTREELPPEILSTFLGYSGLIRRDMDEEAEALRLYEEGLALARSCNNRLLECFQLVNLGDLYFYMRRCDKSIKLLNEALALFETIPNRKLEARIMGCLGNAYWRKPDYDQADSYFTKAIAISQEIRDQRYEGIWLGDLAGVYSDRGNFPAAVEAYKRAIYLSKGAGDRKHESWWSGILGTLYFERQDIAAACTYLEQALSVSEKCFYKKGMRNQKNWLWRIYRQSLLVEKAVRLFKKDQGIEGEGLGESLESFLQEFFAGMAHNYPEAIKKLTAALEIDAKSDQAYFLRGVCRKKIADNSEAGLRNLEEAVADFSQAIALNPGNADYYRQRAWCYSLKGDLAQALPDYEMVINLNPADQIAILEKMEGEIGLRRYPAARATAERLNPGLLSPEQKCVAALLEGILAALQGKAAEPYLGPLLHPDPQLPEKSLWSTEQLTTYLKTLEQEGQMPPKVAKAQEILTLFQKNFRGDIGS